MHDYWNDPPEVPEVPECCDQPMVMDNHGDCHCCICGKTIECDQQIDAGPHLCDLDDWDWLTD